MRTKEISKFLSGFLTFNAIFHGYLLFSDTSLTVAGIALTPALNRAALLVNVALVLGLAWYGWKRSTGAMRTST